MRQQPQAKPQMQTQQGTKNMQQYLQELDALLKRNSGTGLFSAEDTSSNTPMYIPGKVNNPGGIESNASAISAQPTESVIPEFQPPEEEPQEEIPQQEGDLSSLVGFLGAFSQSVYQPSQNKDTEYLEALYQATGTPYGVASMMDGSVKMNTGEIRLPGQGDAFPVASNMDGTVKMSDGSSRRLAPQVANQLRGLEGFAQGVFGQNLDVTQQFGNYNPSLEPGSGYNMGTDLRTRNLSKPGTLPVDARVIDVKYDDGTRWGDQSGHQGYGNSILIELSSGERIRMSHLASLPQFDENGVIKAGTAIIPGQTGNATGEHLDYEYYAAGQDRPSDPSQFSGFKNPMQFLPTGEDQKRQASMVQPEQQPVNQAPQVSQMQPQQESTQPLIAQAAGNVAQNIAQVPQRAGQNIDQNKQLREATRGIGFGASEVLQGNLSGAGKELSNSIETLNPSKRIDTGISELLRGDIAGAKNNFTDTSSRVAQRLGKVPGQISNAIVPKAFAADGNQNPIESLGQNVQGAADSIGKYIGNKTEDVQNTLGQAGQGVKSLGQAGVASLGSLFKPKQEEPKRAIGDVSGTTDPGSSSQFSSLMDSAPSMSKMTLGDTSDPFFKMGGAEMYKQFLRPNSKDMFGGALNMEMFTPEFYKDLGNISSVFGGSKDLSAATDRYIQNERSKYPSMSRMGYEDGYDRGEVDNYNRQVDSYNNSINNYLNEIKSSVSGAKSVFTPVQSSKQNIFAKPSATMSPSAAPRMSLAVPSAKPQMSMARPSSSPQMSSVTRAPQMSVAPKVTQNFTPAKANMTSAATGRPVVGTVAKPAVNMSVAPRMSAVPVQSKASVPQSKPKTNVFSKVTNAIKNVFRR